MARTDPHPVARRLLGGALALLLLASALPLPGAAQSSGAGALPPLGMSMNAVADLKAAGAAPKYGSFWVGPWMATSGWGGLDSALRTGVSTGTTPVVYWYYWGDSISPACVEDGCDGRSKSQWFSMTATLASHLKSEMGGREVLVVLENEFNKGGITDSGYAPTFDAYLAQVADELDDVAGVKIVLGFGAWGESSWTKFPKAAAASDYIGFQTMRASTKDSESSYRGASDRIATLTSFVATKFSKPAFLYDLALSSYPDATWERMQADELDDIFRQLSSGTTTGLQGVVYRTLKDNPNMGLHNYYGYAERHWGLWTYDGLHKPSWDVWLTHALAAKKPVPNVPGAFEAEAMWPTTGGKHTQSSFSGGAGWNVWTNGEVRQNLTAEAPFRARITVAAQGQAAAGVDPTMELRRNGTAVARFTVASGVLRDYVADVDLPGGASLLSVAFTNDALVNGQDRNLLVDRVAVATAPANRAPAAAFDASGVNLTVSVDASASSDPDGDALTYSWTFGDGATATGVAASRTYAAGGTYTVQLVVSDGTLSSSATRTVTAVQPNRAPAAAFQASASDLDVAVDASASSDADGDALTYAWDFGDGATATGKTATHAYADAGERAITLTVSDGRLSSTATRVVSAIQPNRAPAAAFEATVTDLAVVVDASGSTDADGDALVYAWDFGDGTAATGATATHEYAAAGDYVVILTVSDGELESSATRTVSAIQPNRGPVAAFSVDGAYLSFFVDGAASSDADGDALTYAWDFGDGTTKVGPNATHTYAAAGTYLVTLVVSDGELYGSTSHEVVAIQPNRAPVASIAASSADLSFAFDATSSRDPDGDALTYAWDFGDGSAGEGATIGHTYAAAGSYTVTLTVSDGELSSSASTVVEAIQPNRAPVPAFEVSGASFDFRFDASNSSDADGDALAYAWDFGDGTGATGAVVEHAYAAPGTYVVTLTASDGELAASASREVVAVQPNRAPMASFVASGADMTFTFDASGSSDPDGDALVYAWRTDEGATASGVTATFVFATPGEHVVTLNVSDGALSSEAARTVVATLPNRAPTASFTATGSEMAFSFDASGSRDPDGDALTYAWDFGDGGRATGVRATHGYAAAGKYTVTLTVADGNGLTAKTSRVVNATAPVPTPTPFAIEAEAFDAKDNGRAFNDKAASGRQAWHLWSNGAIRTDATVVGGQYKVEVLARGDYAKGWPVMELRLDGKLVGSWTVSSSTWKSYGATLAIPEGEHTLSVHFVNDYWAKGADRNLRVDVLRATPT